MNNEKPIYELHSEVKEWIQKLAFYKDEVGVMQSRLGEVGIKNSGPDVRALIEQFQNRLIVQKERIDLLNHEIKQQENVFEDSVSNNPVAADHRRFPDLIQLTDQVQSFERIFSELRKELDAFLAKWM